MTKRLVIFILIFVLSLFFYVHHIYYVDKWTLPRVTGVNSSVSRLDRYNSLINSIRKKDEIVKRENMLKIGILIPSTTRNIRNASLNKLSLVTTCLPSVYKTLEQHYNYTIYVGVDKNDYLETVKDQLENFDKVKVVVSPGRTFTKSVNAVAKQAYLDKMDYLVRINDDSSFESKEWTTNAISVLQNYNPTNIGVVGPTCQQGNKGILTHDMVHRTHIDIFNFYYPIYFDNWWSDDWITRVYSPNRMTKLSSWVIKHHLKTHGTRYHVDFKLYERLPKTVAFDKKRLDEYLTKRNQTKTVVKR